MRGVKAELNEAGGEGSPMGTTLPEVAMWRALSQCDRMEENIRVRSSRKKRSLFWH